MNRKPTFFPAYQCAGKPSIRKNAWDNWYGYIGRKRVAAFSNTIPGYGMQQEAEQWLADRLVEEKTIKDKAAFEKRMRINGRDFR